MRMEDERKPPQKKFLMGRFMLKDQWENQEEDGRTSFRGHITDRRNARMKETSRRHERLNSTLNLILLTWRIW